jgi:sec-independent protein translocase protein TatA
VGNLGMWEILLILLVVLLLFGAKRLPEVGSSIGKGIREFKRSITDTQDAIMGSEEQRNNLPPRQPDSAQSPSPTPGEPKRLSQ